MIDYKNLEKYSSKQYLWVKSGIGMNDKKIQGINLANSFQEKIKLLMKIWMINEITISLVYTF